MIPLGPGPIPASPAELAERLRMGIQRLFRLSASAPIGVDVGVSTEALIGHINVALTGLELSEGKGVSPRHVLSSTPFTIKNVAIVGSPVKLRSLDVTLLAEGTSLPVAWAEADDGELWIVADASDGAGSSSAAQPPTAHVDASADVAELERAIGTELRARVADAGFTLKSHSLDIQAVGRRELLVRAEATVGKSFLSARVNVNAQAAIDDSMRLTISRVEITSSNPLVGALLGSVNAKLGPWNGRQIDLSDYTFAGARLREVELTVDSRIRVSARFGG